MLNLSNLSDPQGLPDPTLSPYAVQGPEGTHLGLPAVLHPQLPASAAACVESPVVLLLDMYKGVSQETKLLLVMWPSLGALSCQNTGAASRAYAGSSQADAAKYYCC